jgi:hypothetical protein
MRLVQRLLLFLGSRLYRRNVYDALALQHRGEVRGDGLEITHITTQLEVEWWARELHPWDRFAPPEKAAVRFVQQSLADTEAAIARLFHASPMLDVIHLRVLDRHARCLIIEGVVHRSSVVTDPSLSIRMRLVQSGVRFHSPGWCFEALDSCSSTDAVSPYVQMPQTTSGNKDAA